MAICGKKLSLCCLLLSIWGIIMLAIMGILLHVKSVAFAEDFVSKSEEGKVTLSEVLKRYDDGALNCWYACALYGITLVVAGHQFWLNSRSSS